MYLGLLLEVSLLEEYRKQGKFSESVKGLNPFCSKFGRDTSLPFLDVTSHYAINF